MVEKNLPCSDKTLFDYETVTLNRSRIAMHNIKLRLTFRLLCLSNRCSQLFCCVVFVCSCLLWKPAVTSCINLLF